MQELAVHSMLSVDPIPTLAVIGDHEESRRAVSEALVDMGYEVLEAATGAALTTWAAELSLVLVGDDPGAALAAIAQLRKADWAHPVLALHRGATAEMLAAAEAAGADFVLRWPQDLRIVLDTVDAEVPIDLQLVRRAA